MPEDLRLEPGEAVRLAQRLIDEGRPFHAHEVLEAGWKSAQPGERVLWKGLAQIAVGLTHARRGNAAGAVTLLRRGAGAVAVFSRPDAGQDATRPASGELHAIGLDVDIIVAGATELAGRIEAGGLEAVPVADLRLPLGQNPPGNPAG